MTNADSVRTFNRVLELTDELHYTFEASGNNIVLYKPVKNNIEFVKNFNTMEEIQAYLEGIMDCTLKSK